MPTSSGKPCIDFEGGVLGVFPFANGENREDYPLGMLFERLCKIYSLDISNAKIESDDIRTCDAKKVKELVKLCGETCHAAEVQRIIDDNRALINHCEKRLAEFAPFCTVQNKPLHLTHGDAGGNCIVSDNSFYIIDWDQACLAPIERDAWFFMQRWQQIELINKCLEPIGEKLDSDLLCFYCYHTFFYYLCEYLTAVLTFPQIGEKYTKMLRCYFSSWILDPIKVADTIVPGVKVL